LLGQNGDDNFFSADEEGNDSLDGGAGTDSATIDDDGASIVDIVTNVETIST